MFGTLTGHNYGSSLKLLKRTAFKSEFHRVERFYSNPFELIRIHTGKFASPAGKFYCCFTAVCQEGNKKSCRIKSTVRKSWRFPTSMLQ